MTLQPLVLVGGGGHASDVLQAIEAVNLASPTYRVLGILDDAEIDPRRFAGRGVEHIGGIDDVASVDAHYVLCIGWPWTRRLVAERIDDRGTPSAPILHPSADIGVGVDLGAGTVILGNAHISPMVRMGGHSLVSYNATIGHDCTFGDFASVMPGANVSGDVIIGHDVLIGTGAVVREGLRIGDGVRIGAGAVVMGDVGSGRTIVGTGPPK